MRIVLDTNVLISALINPNGLPGKLYNAWFNYEFELVTSAEQIDELDRVLKYPKLERFIKSREVRIIINRLNKVAHMTSDLPKIDKSPDPNDNFILATAIAGNADFIVSGDQKGLLDLKEIEGIKIINTSTCLKILETLR